MYPVISGSNPTLEMDEQDTFLSLIYIFVGYFTSLSVRILYSVEW
jgi:hypothetical protein